MANGMLIQQDPSIERKRALAQAMMQRGMEQGPVQHWTQGLDRIASSLLGAHMGKGADESDAARRQEAMAKLTEALAGSGGAPAGGGAQPSAPFADMSGGGMGATEGPAQPTGPEGSPYGRLISAMSGINPEMALNLRMQQMQQETAAQQAKNARLAKLRDAEQLYRTKKTIDQDFPKPESEFDQYLKTLQAEKLKAQTEKTTQEVSEKEEAKKVEEHNVQSAADKLVELVGHEGFGNIYGSFQGAVPSVRRESVDAEAIRDQVVDLLSLSARGQLKGQGQITEGEQGMLKNAQTILKNPRISDEAAMAEAGNVLRYLQSKGAEIPPQVMQVFQAPAPGGGGVPAGGTGGAPGGFSIRRIE